MVFEKIKYLQYTTWFSQIFFYNKQKVYIEYVFFKNYPRNGFSILIIS